MGIHRHASPYYFLGHYYNTGECVLHGFADQNEELLFVGLAIGY
ncbi:MAG: hypothetical protein ACLU61_05765 [Lachnospiraceae bacterium]